MTDVTKNIGLEAYGDFEVFSKLSYGCIKYLMNNNELVWKLLKYTGPDAWKEDDLTQAEKGALIYAGQQDTSDFHVFLDSKQPDVYVEETTILRISPSFAMGLNRTIGYINLSMEVFSHYKINHLSNYQTRIDTITAELLGLFNGANIEAGVGSLGLMSFNKMVDTSSRLFEVGQIPFGGKQIVFTIFTA
jgi:hypothetical protein